ncbi:hypothetical protein TSUD_397000 [Trifolium subterraneum]|uniref:Reverse transcriptase Ty1/copia-type domain-containing protein n=1 Tax=Trifolium subterraneum TaxID=3900 RepID=A0A2Z6NAY6_TRISU|nr:hypothetical protein TSUD_397000 [Trifolium subterraneum]
MAKNAKFISEGGSSNKPPLVDGDNYYYWKDKTELFLRSQDNNMWHVVEVAEYVPLAKDSTNPKPQAEWTTIEADRVLLNTKAKLFIKSALCREEYDRIMESKTAKEIWETLQTHHEGTNSVKETRIDIGVRKFELFEMKEEETIDQMYGRFTSIINELNSLGKTYTTHERIRKILRCLPKTWRPIVTAITVAKDLTKVSLEDLIGSLKAHESILQEDKPKKKMIALETQSGECSQKNEILCEDKESLQEDDEEELAFLSRRIQRLMTRRNQLKKNFQPKRNGIKPEDDLEEAQSEDEEQEANVCLMTHSNAEEVTLDPCLSCQKTEHLFDNLLYDTQILNQKNAKLRDEITVLTKERDEYKKESSLKSEVIKGMQTAHTELSKSFEILRKDQKECSEECLLAVKRRSWYLDSGCSRHMTGDKNSFLSFETREGGSVTFGNNEKASIKDNLGKFDSKSDKGIFLGYSLTSKAYRIYNLRTQTLEESMHVKFDEFEDQPTVHTTDDEEDEPIIAQNHDSDENLTSQGPPKTWRIVGYHPPDQIIGNTEDGVVRNKARLVAQGYNQQEGIDYDKTFDPVASEFEMSMMGEHGFFLGLKIKQQEDGIFISQEKYVNDLLKKYKMNEAKIMSTPMHPSTSLDKDEKGKDVSEKEYRGMIGSLLYLTASRPDIVFAVGLCARFQTSPKESHLIAVKRIFRYLVGTPDVGLWYKKGSHFDLQAYCDADYLGDKIERKSTSGACQFLGEALVSWCCRKQNTIALSTTEAEYVAASNCCSQVIWIKNQLEDFSLSFIFSTSLSITSQTTYSKSVSEREVTPEIQSSPVTTNMQTTVENPPNLQNSPNTVFETSPSKSLENSPIHLTQNQPPSPSPVDSPKQSPNPTNEENSPSPTATIRSPKDSPPVLVKIKKSKSFDSSKIRRSSRIMSGACKKPVVDTTVHVLDQSDSEIDLLEKETDEFELESVTSTKSEPVKPKKTPTPKKKEVETAVKAPRTKKMINVKKSKEKLLPAPLIQPEDEDIFDNYWNTKLIAVSRMYNFAELSIGGVNLVKFVEPFEWKSFFHIKETVYPLLVQTFYFNAMVFPEKDLITSNIKDVELVVDPYVIGSLIGIKSEGMKVYGNDWYDHVKINKEDLKKKMFTEEGAKKNAPPSSMLKTEYKLLHNMCQHSFFPRIGSKDKVTDLDLLMMYHMAKRVKLNLPYVILHHMIHAATSGFKKIALPYAMLLTRVFRLYYADMNDTPFENYYYTFSLKNVSHMKKEVESSVADVGVKRKREVFEKSNLNVLADASGDRLENDLQTDGNTQISGDADPTTESEKLVTTAATTLQGFKPMPVPPNTTMFSPLMTSSQGSLSSFCTSEFIRNILTSDTLDISTMPIPNPTDSTLPSIPSSFATFDSFCSSVNAANAGTQQLVFEGNVNFDFPGPSRPTKRFRLETDMEQMRKDLDIVIKGMVVQHSMMDLLILESKTLRNWFTTVVCPQLHLPPPPEIETPQFDPFPA